MLLLKRTRCRGSVDENRFILSCFELLRWIAQRGEILSPGTFEINTFASLEQTTSEEEQDLISGDR